MENDLLGRLARIDTRLDDVHKDLVGVSKAVSHLDATTAAWASAQERFYSQDWLKLVRKVEGIDETVDDLRMTDIPRIDRELQVVKTRFAMVAAGISTAVSVAAGWLVRLLA